MLGAILVTAAALVVTLLCARWFLTAAWYPVTRDRIDRFARRQSLTVSVAGGPLLVRYLATTRRWRGGGLLLSVAGTASLPLLVHVLGPPGIVRTGYVSVSFIGLFVGWFAGAVVAEWRISAAAPGGRRRASLQPRRLADYLPRGVWLMPAALWSLLALADLAGLIYLAIVHPAGLAPIIGWIVLDSAVAAVLIVVGRRVLLRPQRAAGADAVETDDAIRSRSLHVLAGSALTLGGYLLVGTIDALAPYSTVLDDGVAGVLGVVCGLLIPLLGYLTATATSGPIRRQGPAPA